MMKINGLKHNVTYFANNKHIWKAERFDRPATKSERPIHSERKINLFSSKIWKIYKKIQINDMTIILLS